MVKRELSRQGERLVQRQRGGRECAEFRALQIQLSVLTAVYGRWEDEAGEMSRGLLRT